MGGEEDGGGGKGRCDQFLLAVFSKFLKVKINGEKYIFLIGKFTIFFNPDKYI